MDLTEQVSNMFPSALYTQSHRAAWKAVRYGRNWNDYIYMFPLGTVANVILAIHR